jgi:aryl-alcohol dehydrogenase-like predicted oxidoreductase
MKIETAHLGKSGPLVGRLGYGAMVLEGFYGEADEASGIKTLVHAIERGMMIDSADAYGNGHNEALIAKALKETNETAFIATKYGIVFDENEVGTEIPTNWGFSLNINNTPEYASKCLDASLSRLGVDAVDLWYAHFIDPAVAIEESVGAMAEEVKKGKVKHLGLSNATADEIRRAHAIHPIAAVQYEYSLWRREVEEELLPTLRELDIALVGWSPLGGGFLTGTINKLEEGDFRNNNPKFQGENLKTNLDRFAPLNELASELGISPAQLALAWLLHQGSDVFPIPGTRKTSRLDENADALKVELTPEQLHKIDEIASLGSAEGKSLI